MSSNPIKRIGGAMLVTGVAGALASGALLVNTPSAFAAPSPLGVISIEGTGGSAEEPALLASNVSKDDSKVTPSSAKESVKAVLKFDKNKPYSGRSYAITTQDIANLAPLKSLDCDVTIANQKTPLTSDNGIVAFTEPAGGAPAANDGIECEVAPTEFNEKWNDKEPGQAQSYLVIHADNDVVGAQRIYADLINTDKNTFAADYTAPKRNWALMDEKKVVALHGAIQVEGEELPTASNYTFTNIPDGEYTVETVLQDKDRLAVYTSPSEKVTVKDGKVEGKQDLTELQKKTELQKTLETTQANEKPKSYTVVTSLKNAKGVPVAAGSAVFEPSVKEPTTPPAEEPTEEPSTPPTTPSTPEPTEEPTPKPTEEPTTEPTQKPTPEPTTGPTQEPTAEPTTEPTQTPEPTTTPTETPSATASPTTPATTAPPATTPPATTPPAAGPSNNGGSNNAAPQADNGLPEDSGLNYYDDTLAKTGSDSNPAWLLLSGGLVIGGAALLAGNKIASRRKEETEVK